MTKDELWNFYVERNKSFDGEGTITMSKKGLKKLFETTWHRAYQEGLKSTTEGKSFDSTHGNKSSNTVPDFFKGIFDV